MNLFVVFNQENKLFFFVCFLLKLDTRTCLFETRFRYLLRLRSISSRSRSLSGRWRSRFSQIAYPFCLLAAYLPFPHFSSLFQPSCHTSSSFVIRLRMPFLTSFEINMLCSVTFYNPSFFICPRKFRFR